jgi:WD40 repeat protein
MIVQYGMEGEVLEPLKGQHGDIFSITSTSNGHLFSASSDRSIVRWNIKTGEPIQVLSGHAKDVNSICVTMDESFLFSASDDTTIRQWSIKVLTCTIIFY